MPQRSPNVRYHSIRLWFARQTTCWRRSRRPRRPDVTAPISSAVSTISSATARFALVLMLDSTTAASLGAGGADTGRAGVTESAATLGIGGLTALRTVFARAEHRAPERVSGSRRWIGRTSAGGRGGGAPGGEGARREATAAGQRDPSGTHFAGHCFFDAGPGRSGWVFARRGAGDRASCGGSTACRVRFSNACESGVAVDRTGDRSARSWRPSFAEAFFARGVGNFVCTAWPVDDEAAREFAQTLYQPCSATTRSGPRADVGGDEGGARTGRRLKGGGAKSWGAYSIRQPALPSGGGICSTPT